MTTTWQAVNVNTGTTEGPKFNATGDTSEIWIVNLGTTLGLNDLINGPVIPAGVFVTNVVVDSDDMDSAASPLLQFEVGYTNTGTTVAGAFIASGNTIAGVGGIARANVAGTVGFTSTLNTTVQAKITAAAGTAVAGHMRFLVDYTASP